MRDKFSYLICLKYGIVWMYRILSILASNKKFRFIVRTNCINAYTNKIYKNNIDNVILL